MKKFYIPFEGFRNILFEIIKNCTFLLKGVKIFSIFQPRGIKTFPSSERGFKIFVILI